MNGWELRKAVVNEELDYLTLMSLLSGYASPRDKISRFLKDGVLIQVKRGFYVFGPKFSEKSYSKESIANLIYGPSAVSLDYALSFYHFIPERVETVTSITTKKNKVYDTPIGRFSYAHLSRKCYVVGLDQLSLDETHNIMIATPEKALADKLLLGLHGVQLGSIAELEAHLFENLRIDQERFMTLNLERAAEINKEYKNPNVELLFHYLLKLR